MTPEIRYSMDRPNVDAWTTLFGTTGWNETYQTDRHTLGRALAGSWRLVCARVDRELVGGGRLISDGTLYALLADVIVTPQWRGQGIGREIVRRLLNEADRAGIRDVLLFAATGTEAFYESLGFARRGDDQPGMLRRSRTP